MFDKILQFFGINKNIKQLFAGKRILVVDDSDIDRRILQKVLTRYGLEVVLAIDGEGALKKLEKEKVDLILLDCQMPGMQGVEVCRQIKQNETTKNIPVLFLTGLDTPKNIIECFEADAENYLSKPINAKLLTSHIRMIFQEQASSV